MEVLSFHSKMVLLTIPLLRYEPCGGVDGGETLRLLRDGRPSMCLVKQECDC